MATRETLRKIQRVIPIRKGKYPLSFRLLVRYANKGWGHADLPEGTDFVQAELEGPRSGSLDLGGPVVFKGKKDLERALREAWQNAVEIVKDIERSI